MVKIPTGAKPIDMLLDGGIETDIITTFYGPAGSGKTNIAIVTSVNVASAGKKVVYIDTEGGFSFERVKQIAKGNFENILKNTILFKPTTFQEQKKYVFKTYNMVSSDDSNIGLVVVDSISMLYRLELGDYEAREVNRELARQLQLLSNISRKHNIPVLVTNQVYSSFEDKDKIEVVGGDLTKYWSKTLVELRIINTGIRVAILKKHRHLPEGRQTYFKIANDGIIETHYKFLS